MILKQKLNEQLERLKTGADEISEKVFIPLPGKEWEDFANSKGVASWRSLPACPGRGIEIKTNGPFYFGLHSHRELEERLHVVDGFCLFGEGDIASLPFLRAGESAIVKPTRRHALRMLTGGKVQVWWDDLKKDEIELWT